ARTTRFPECPAPGDRLRGGLCRSARRPRSRGVVRDGLAAGRAGHRAVLHHKTGRGRRHSRRGRRGHGRFPDGRRSVGRAVRAGWDRARGLRAGATGPRNHV
ncbi:MAG: hypothetical protein AVDCRST_MAG02-4703, partial [uncultured Rubrobacteraceae bacterium]